MFDKTIITFIYIFFLLLGKYSDSEEKLEFFKNLTKKIDSWLFFNLKPLKEYLNFYQKKISLICNLWTSDPEVPSFLL